MNPFHRGAAAIALATLPALGGCGSAFYQHHYFKSVDAHGNPVNYYKVTVRGGTVLSSSRYVSGYFDETAVDKYFSEYTQPDKAEFNGSAAAPAAAGDTTTPAAGAPAAKSDGSVKVVPLDDSKAGRKLLLLLSSNSDEIATGISSLAQSDDVTNTLQQVIGRDRVTAASTAQTNQQLASKEGAALKAMGTTTMTNVATDLTPDANKKVDRAAARAALLSYANRLASYLEPGRSFTSLEEAAQWVAKNGTKLQEKK